MSLSKFKFNVHRAIHRSMPDLGLDNFSKLSAALLYEYDHVEGM